MSIENWSDNILIADLQDDPAFTDDMTALIDQVERQKNVGVVLKFAGVNYINSSNVAKLLKLRKQLLADHRRLVLCEINNNVWGLFLVTGLDKVFEFADSVSTALAMLQIEA